MTFVVSLITYLSKQCSFIYILAGYPASLGVPIIHILCIIKLREELIAEVSLTIVTARRRRNSASNRANFDTITSIEHARWGLAEVRLVGLEPALWSHFAKKKRKNTTLIDRK